MSNFIRFLLVLLVLEMTVVSAFEIHTFSGSLFSTNTSQMDDSLGITGLANFAFGVEVRNLYIRIDAEAGETISSIGIDTVGGSLDGLVFDRVAFTGAVPEPSFLFPFVIAMIFMIRRTTAD